jgi:hypothetical protein
MYLCYYKFTDNVCPFSEVMLRCHSLQLCFRGQNETDGNCHSVESRRLASHHYAMVDGRLGSRSRGYHPDAPTPIAAGPLCPPLVPPVISRGTPRQSTLETSVSERRNYGREMAGQFGLRFRLPRKSQGAFTCHKFATWDRWVYFPSEGRHAVEFFEPAILGTRGQHANH